VTARHQARQGPRQVVGRGPADEGAPARTRLDDPKELEGPECLADGCPRDLELLRQLTLRRQLVASLEVPLFEKTLDLLDNPLVETASADGFDDGQVVPPRLLDVAKRTGIRALVRWSDQARQE